MRHWVPCGSSSGIRNERLVLKRFDDYWGKPYYFSQLNYQLHSEPEHSDPELILQNELDFISGFPQKDKFEQIKSEPNVKNGKVVLSGARLSRVPLRRLQPPASLVPGSGVPPGAGVCGSG